MSSTVEITEQDYQSSWEDFQRTERIKELPMRVRLGLRDEFYKADGETQKAIEAVSKEIGVKIEIHIDWAKAWTVLAGQFKEMSNFVPSVSRVVIALVNAIKNNCDDDVWVDKLLDSIEARKKKTLDIFLLSDAHLVSAAVFFLPHNASIALKLPEADADAYRRLHEMALGSLLKPIFSEADKAREAGADDEEWQDTEVDDVKVPIRGLADEQKVKRFPHVNELLRPEQLLDEAVPYFVTLRSFDGIDIQSSHPRTLNLIEAYVTARGARNPHNREQAWIDINRSSAWIGSGEASDRLHITNKTQWGPFLTPLPIVGLLQQSLGYELHYTDGSTWVFRRDAPFT